MGLIRPEDVAADGSSTEEGKKVFFVSLGCPKNRVDAEVMLGTLATDGYRVVQTAEEADVLVVNTCSFVDEAKEESVNAILDMAGCKDAGNKKLVVSGCLAQRYSDQLEKDIPEVDLFIGTGEYHRIANLLEKEPESKIKMLQARILEHIKY